MPEPTTWTIERSPPRPADAHALVLDILHAVRDAADPAVALARHWVTPARPTRVLAIGKASEPMLRTTLALLAEPPRAALAVCPLDQHPHVVIPGARVLPGDHPYPTLRSLVAGLAVREFIDDADESEQVILLLSGGASSLVCLPDGALEVADVADVNRRLQLAGAPIGDLNTVRKHTEQLKGGRLAERCRASIEAYILSDVIGDRLDVIGSGPVSPDPTTYADAIRVLEQRGVSTHAPAVMAHLHRGAAGDIPETPKPGHAIVFRVGARIIATNRTAVEAARDRAASLGFHIAGVQHALEGEASDAGRALAARAIALRAAGAPTPWAWIAGGEWTVTVREASGVGGPSQELALAAAGALGAAPGAGVTLGAFSTDGRDGPTDAAGAIVDSDTPARARAHGLDLADAVARHDTHRALDTLGGALRTGPTGTNVNHVVVMLGW
ncbi:MAG: DUF4147 domain-containing protein [Planctomycetota bacterium]|nr:DUF4147 domain-containing protein [Planctomycetota bacterium]